MRHWTIIQITETNFNGNIAQLLAKTSNNNGGIAWLDVLCGNNYKHVIRIFLCHTATSQIIRGQLKW